MKKYPIHSSTIWFYFRAKTLFYRLQLLEVRNLLTWLSKELPGNSNISFTGNVALEITLSGVTADHWIRNSGGGASNLCFNNPPEVWFWCRLKFENHLPEHGFCFCNSPLPTLPRVRFLSILFLLPSLPAWSGCSTFQIFPTKSRSPFLISYVPGAAVSSFFGWGSGRGLGLTVPGITGKFSLGEQNEAGQKLTKFCQENALVIANTLFQQHKRWFYIWT